MSEVIFLAHRSNDRNIDTTSLEVLVCGTCKNKAWTVVYEVGGDGFPRMRCTCCGQDGGHFGWVNDGR